MGEFKKYLAEFIGTYTLVFCGTGAIVMNDVSGGVVSHLGVAICFGIVVMAMIYSFGSISGAHINPAVTLAFYFSKRFPKQLVGGYITAQIIGAILASFTLKMLFPTHETLGITLPFDGSAQTFVLEVILTFFLMLVIIFTSTGSKETGTLAGLAIGGVVLMEALFAGPITGAS
jgi:aquaporin NIP